MDLEELSITISQGYDPNWEEEEEVGGGKRGGVVDLVCHHQEIPMGGKKNHERNLYIVFWKLYVIEWRGDDDGNICVVVCHRER